jgi:hypothetical protein
MPKRRTLQGVIRISSDDLMLALERLSRQLADMRKDISALRKDFRSHDHTQLPGRHHLRLHASPSGVSGPAGETSDAP